MHAHVLIYYLTLTYSEPLLHVSDPTHYNRVLLQFIDLHGIHI